MKKDILADIQREFKSERAELVPVLQRIQAICGYLTREAIEDIARWLKISENEIYGVATFYAQFRFTPPGLHHLKVCLGTACHVKGGEQMLAVMKRRLEINPGETTADGKYDLERVACLGCCALAPVVTFDDKTYAQMSVLKLIGILDEHKKTG
jgi:NADH-quinone oxidoreductase subunit E